MFFFNFILVYTNTNKYIDIKTVILEPKERSCPAFMPVIVEITQVEKQSKIWVCPVLAEF